MNSTETSDFWVGYFPTEEEFNNYFGESDTWDGDSDQPISEFAREQDETWFDHDFFECNYNSEANSIAEVIKGCSYADQFGTKLESKITEMKIEKVNFVVFLTKGEIKSPKSITNSQFQMQYVGQISYNI